ncbi:MAG: aminoacyl-histidine dipeptidase [Bacteroidetes bacterium]|nr:aminoacyl-histidine dipeptidase [Bacteroidota bacterium]
MSNPLANLEPKEAFYYFGELTKYPRPSKKEDKAVAFVEAWAKENNLELEKDKRGNIIIRKPATPGMENKQSVCIQGHLDMVCVASEGVDYDFENKGIEAYVDGDYVKAKNTSLGADDGIAIAMGMALLASKDIPHPALELLCTMDEETGLTGAIQLSNNLIKSRLLVNIDSEVEGVFTIGCAGGINTEAHFKYEAAPVPANHAAYKISVGGLKGGHSGMEINDGRANALKLLNRILYNAIKKCNIKVSDFNGGAKHNAIPSSASSVVLVPCGQEKAFEELVKEMSETVKKEFITKEPDVKIEAVKTDMPKRIMAEAFQNRLIASFYTVAHGVLRMSPDVKGLVQSSTNFAIVETREDEVFVLTSQRSTIDSEKINIVDKVCAAFELAGATTNSNDGYPAWEPNVNSKLLELGRKVYKEKFGKEPVIEVIHAGLECGLIGDKYHGMDMISIGPNLSDVHSPAEKLQISSTKRIWDFLVELLKNIPDINVI